MFYHHKIFFQLTMSLLYGMFYVVVIDQKVKYWNAAYILIRFTALPYYTSTYMYIISCYDRILLYHFVSNDVDIYSVPYGIHLV